MMRLRPEIAQVLVIRIKNTQSLHTLVETCFGENSPLTKLVTARPTPAADENNDIDHKL